MIFPSNVSFICVNIIAFKGVYREMNQFYIRKKVRVQIKHFKTTVIENVAIKLSDNINFWFVHVDFMIQ